MTNHLLPDPKALVQLGPRRQRRETISTARKVISSLSNDLRQIDQRLGTLSAAIPPQGDQFDVLEELGAGVRCVRSDLMTDAIEPLEALAHLDDEGLFRRYEERLKMGATVK